ncbi:hypothetical protein HF885_09655 [Olsenella umbonata]|uniref:Uncharacterized protein n=1 Tax=Parafannyhessea umbonata TaxID=604330 RepID=A0A7X9Y110_9ACTN|nr:hypothetical protein [Parafannyhessea umbonata]
MIDSKYWNNLSVYPSAYLGKQPSTFENEFATVYRNEKNPYTILRNAV